MKVYEYQAKRILSDLGVPVPRGGVASQGEEAGKIAESIGGRVVVKAQVYAGGRGKGGGVRLASDPQEAMGIAAQILGMRLVTPQTPLEGIPVRQVLVEEALEVGKELYLGMVIDRSRAMPVMMASEAGGMDIEEIAVQAPQKILKLYIDPLTGWQPFMGRKLAFGLHLEPALIPAATRIMAALYRAFSTMDCSLVEINPLVITGGKGLLALDAKMNFDDNALSRHPEIAELRDFAEEDPLEVEATRHGISYIKLSGSIGCMVNGAGLAMATMDLIKLAGTEPANFLDVGGGASVDQVARAFQILISNPQVKVVLVNIFGGILRGDVVAQGIIKAMEGNPVEIPVVVRLTGTNAEEGMRMLAGSGLKAVIAADLWDGAQKAVSILGQVR